MSVGFGFSVGDILACGKFCHQIYKACFSEAHDASADWAALGKELLLLGDALQNLCSNDGIIPQDPFCGPEKEHRALEAVRVVVGDFRETLKDLRTFLLRYDDFQKPDAGKQYWLKIKFSVNSAEVAKFRARVAMHTRAVDLLLNPLIYESQRNVQSAVTSIQTRIDTIDQVLQALLVVASQQLTTASSSHNPTRIADRAHIRLQDGHPQYLLPEPPRNPRIMPAPPATNEDTPRNKQQIFRTNSIPIRGDRYENAIEMGPRRSSTEINMTNTHSPTSPYPPNGMRGFPANRGGDERCSTRFSLTSTEIDSSGYGAQRQNSPPGATELSDNPISRALQQSAWSESAKKRPIEHWITAAMHWYFKAEKDLGDPNNPEVSLEAYLGLMKSSWIVENVIKKWEAEDDLPEEITRNIETLVVLIVDQFRKIGGREMPNIRNIGPQDYEIWDEDIVPVLVEPASRLSSRASSRQGLFGCPIYYDDPTPRKPSQASSCHTRATTPPDFYSSHENFSGSPASQHSPSLPSSSSRASSLRSSESGQNLASPTEPEPRRIKGRSPSTSTTSTGSSGRRESSTPTCPTSTTPAQASGESIATRRPVPASPTSYPATALQPPDDDPESYEGLDERTILNATEIMWASQVSGPFQRGTVKVFWHQPTRFFRIYTKYSPRRAHSQEVSLRGTEMVPHYAYEDEPTIYLRRTARPSGPVSGPRSGPPTTSSTVGGDTARIGHVYKFHTPKSMFDFQRALTSERVYQDLEKRVASVKFKRSSENGTHSYHNARLQLWHENPPADALFTDAASGMTGVSQATRAKLVLSCSRLMIYFGGSGSFLTCFLTDDITLKRDDHKLMLEPTKYGGSFWRSPKAVKAAIRGSENCKGGFRLDKDKISPDDEHNFESFSYIHLNFKDVEYLNRFQRLWDGMMFTRRAERVRIRSLTEQLQGAARAPLAVN